MAIRRVLQIDNPDDKKVLKTRTHPVKTITPALRTLVADMFETMHQANGVGIAAPQVGVSQRVAVVWIPAETEERPDGTTVEIAPEQNYVLVNPRIVKTSPKEELGQEGCLSLPGWYGEVPRASWVTVEYQDLDGKWQRLRKVDGLLGRALQHEIDHLEGVLFTERIRDISTLKDYRHQDQDAPSDQPSEQVA